MSPKVFMLPAAGKTLITRVYGKQNLLTARENLPVAACEEKNGGKHENELLIAKYFEVRKN